MTIIEVRKLLGPCGRDPQNFPLKGMFPNERNTDF
jgi:hypothetical protein